MRAIVLGVLPAVLLAVPFSGCFGDLLSEGPLTTLRFACGVMDRTRSVEVVAHAEPGTQVPEAAVRRLAAQLEEVARRPEGSVAVSVAEGPVAPQGAWTLADLEAWAGDQETEPRGGTRLHVLWVSALPEGEEAGVNLAPAAFAVSAAQVQAGAQATGRSAEDVATVLLLHYAGHALGLVNDGVPVQDPDLAKREEPPRHDPDPGSAMHANWHQAATMPAPAVPSGTTGPEQALRFPAGAVADLRGAAAPGGVCP